LEPLTTTGLERKTISLRLFSWKKECEEYSMSRDQLRLAKFIFLSSGNIFEAPQWGKLYYW
jgi:hypothetical protein